MPVNTKHPEYSNRLPDWVKVRDAIEGEAALRRNISDYLPIPPGLADPVESLASGRKAVTNTRYSFYASLAEFPEIVSPTLNGILGLVHEKDPTVELPPALQYLHKDATPDGESLLDLWERCTQEVLTTGRFITLAEIYGDELRLCQYPTESFINWRQMSRRDGGGLLLGIFKETRLEPDGDDPYSHEEVTYYRQVAVENGVYTVRVFIENDGDFEPVEIDDKGQTAVQPSLLGRTFDHVPITIVNALDIGFEFGPVPLLPMTRRALSIFRRSADYNRSLYTKGDPQCVLWGVAGDDIPSEIGGSTIWAFENPDGKAQYLDIDGQGIPLMRDAINDEFKRFADEVGMLMEGSATGYESGEALRRRQSMRQVTIKSVVINAAEGLQTALRDIGRLRGMSEAEIEKIRFVPNLDFSEPMMTGQELLQLVTAKRDGAPMSDKTLHDLMRRRQLTTLEHEEERALISAEDPLPASTPGQVPGDQSE